MEKEQKEIVVTLETLWSTLKAAGIWMLAAILLVGGATLAFSLATYQPSYTTTVSFYLVNMKYQEDATNAGSQYNNILLAHSAAEDCVYMLTLDEVENDAREANGIAASEPVHIKVDMPLHEDSCIISIHTTASSPEIAYAMANGIFESGKVLVKETSNLDMNIISHGTLATEPSNARISVYVYVSTILSGILVYVVFLLLRILNRKIVSVEDAENVLGVSVLGVVPNKARAEGKRYEKYYGKYYGK